MIKQGYVDDCVGGGDNDGVVDRLIGKEVWMDGRPNYDGSVAKIMELGGFQVKVLVRSGEQRADVVELLGGEVMGMPWDTANNALHLDVNLYPKIRKMRTGLELQPH